MKKFFLLSCLIPFVSFASPNHEEHITLAYQELCAKEHDPVKRQNYCNLFEKNGQLTPALNNNIFRKDIAVV